MANCVASNCRNDNTWPTPWPLLARLGWLLQLRLWKAQTNLAFPSAFPSLFSGTPRRVCNFFQRPFSEAFRNLNPVVNGLRKASKATTTYPVSKYRKIGERGILAAFPAGKQETSDFLATKYGCLPWKVRMFLPKKSDVFAPKHGIFWAIFAVFDGFCRKNHLIMRKTAGIRILNLTSKNSKTSKIAPKFALKGTRSLVKIFEGSRPLCHPF